MPAKQRLSQLISQLQPELERLPLGPIERVAIGPFVGMVRTMAEKLDDEQAEMIAHGFVNVAVRGAIHILGDADRVVATVRAAVDDGPVAPRIPPPADPPAEATDGR